MDSKPQMPDIKAEVNKVDDGKKKATGLLGGLFGGGGSGAAGGLGGLGAGGLLATKAGMLALVLMGSAVAGGIGLAGYKMFGPGEADKIGGNLSLFAPRQPAADPNAVAPVNADGSSASLNFASAAAAKDKAAEAAEAAAAAASASAEAPTDAAAGDAAKDAAAADAARREANSRAASGAALANGGGGAAGTMGRGLTNTKKLGALSGAVGGGGSTSASASTKLGDNLANAAKNGASSAFSRQGGGAAKASNARSVAGRGGRSARAQARNVMGDHAGGKAGSSFAAGRTYDGSASGGGGAIGPDGGSIGMGGVGDGAGSQPKTLAANSAGSTKEQDPPVPEAPAKDVTPWAKQIMMGMAAGAIAVALMMFASSMIEKAKATYAKVVATGVGALAAAPALVTALQLGKVLIGAAIALGLAGIAMGAMISGGQNGQTLQGGLLIASSAAIVAAGGWLMSTTLHPIPKTPEAIAADKHYAAFGVPTTWMYVIGGMGAVGLVGTMMAPKKTCKSDQDGCHAYIQQQPSPTNYTV